MQKQQPKSTYRGGEFRDMMRQYSFDRMDRDPRYRRDVHEEMKRRRQATKQQEKTP